MRGEGEGKGEEDETADHLKLATKSGSKLRALYHKALNAAARSDRNSEEQHNTSASLANIQRVMS